MASYGAIGFKHNGSYLITDAGRLSAHPEHLGNCVVEFVRKSLSSDSAVEDFISKVSNLTLTSGELEGSAVGSEILEGIKAGTVKRLASSPDLLKNSYSCDYAYILNLDDRVLEFYDGMQTKPQPKNPFGQEPAYHCDLGTFYPLALGGRAPFTDIPAWPDWHEKFLPEDFNQRFERVN